MTFDQSVRLFVLTAYAMTCLICFLRVFRTPDVRARVGNVAFGFTCAVAWFSQIHLWAEPATVTTWLLAAAGVSCLVYLATLVRKGL